MFRSEGNFTYLLSFFNLLRYLTLTLSVYIGILTVSENATANSKRFLSKGHLVVDLQNGVEWLRCTVGQSYINGTCDGEVIQFRFDEISEITKLANKELGGNWRLPTKKELSSLICKTCPAPKIDQKIFPLTSSEPYWTGQKNWFSSKMYWSINFMTGYSFSHSFAEKPLAVRLVRDRKSR